MCNATQIFHPQQHRTIIPLDRDEVDSSSSVVHSDSASDGLAPMDVVCQRGRQFWNHRGNRFYRDVIGNACKKYSQSRNKTEKSLVVREVIEAVHARNGRFVKKARKDGPWVEVDETFAREKTSQHLRDGLSNKYKSATKAKRERRTKQDQLLNGDIDRVINSSPLVVNKMNDLSRRVKQLNATKPPVSEEVMSSVFSQANIDMLATIKSDQSLLLKLFKTAGCSTSSNIKRVNEVSYSDMDFVNAVDDDENDGDDDSFSILDELRPEQYSLLSSINIIQTC